MPRRSSQVVLTVVGLDVVLLLTACSGGESQSTDTPNIPATVAAAVEPMAQTEVIATAVEATVDARRAAATTPTAVGPLVRAASFRGRDFDRGAILQKEGRVQQAIDQYDQAIRLNPLYAPTYYNRGLAYYDLGQFQRAIEDFDEAFRLGSSVSKLPPRMRRNLGGMTGPP